MIRNWILKEISVGKNNVDTTNKICPSSINIRDIFKNSKYAVHMKYEYAYYFFSIFHCFLLIAIL